MKKIYTAQSIINCNMVQNVLEESGIETFLKNEHTCNIAGAELGPLVFAWPEVWIADENDLEKAKTCLKQSKLDFLKKNEAHSDEACEEDSLWICPDCKEELPSSFEVCWNCGHEAPEELKI